MLFNLRRGMAKSIATMLIIFFMIVSVGIETARADLPTAPPGDPGFPGIRPGKSAGEKPVGRGNLGRNRLYYGR